jgi:hypothetical protein
VGLRKSSSSARWAGALDVVSKVLMLYAGLRIEPSLASVVVVDDGGLYTLGTTWYACGGGVAGVP